MKDMQITYHTAHFYMNLMLNNELLSGSFLERRAPSHSAECEIFAVSWREAEWESN